MHQSEGQLARSWPIKWVLYVTMIFCFVIITTLVYSDYPVTQDRIMPPLSPTAQSGLSIWRDQNCQSCHQIYGFGGFLGPDLTNVHARITPVRLQTILETGSGRMPAFGFSQQEIQSLAGFFKELDSSGQGTPEYHHELPAGDLAALALAKVGDAGDMPESARRGAALFQQFQCKACHMPFKKGTVNAPDLSLTSSNASPAELLDVLKSGRGLMPPFGLEGENAQDVIAFLGWVGLHRETLVQNMGGPSELEWKKVPWFSYVK